MSFLKKSLSLFLSCIMAFSFILGAVSAVELKTSAEVQSGAEGEEISSLSTEIVYGDINGDGKINLDDVIKLLRHVSKADIITDSNTLAAAEIVDDGALNLDDVVRLLGFVSKAIPNLKGEKPELFHRELTEEAIVTDEETGTMFASGEIVIVTEFDVKKEYVEELITPYNGEIVGVIELAKTYQVYFENLESLSELEALAEELAADESVKSATVNYVSEYSLNWVAPNDYEQSYGDIWQNSETAMGNNWNLEAIDMVDAWKYIDETDTIKVGVMDNAFYTGHDDLDFGMTWQNAMSGGGDRDHGNHVAGIIGAKWGNGGIAGVVQNAEIYASAFGTVTDVNYGVKGDILKFIYAVTNMVTNDVSVINFSMGDYSVEVHSMGSSKDKNLQKFADSVSDSLSNLLDSGEEFLIVQSAGNQSNSNHPINGVFGTSYNEQGWVDTKWSAQLSRIKEQRVRDRIIIVGGLGVEYSEGRPEYSIAGYSNIGDGVDIVAPGGCITVDGDSHFILSAGATNGVDQNGNVIYDDNVYKFMIGTSMAAPHVTGVSALVWALRPELTGSQVKSIILNNYKTTVEVDTSEPYATMGKADFDENGSVINRVLTNPTVDESVMNKTFVYPVLNAEAAVAAALDYRAVMAHVIESEYGNPVKDAKITLYNDTFGTEIVFNVDDKGKIWEYIKSPVLVNRAKIEAEGYETQTVELKYSYTKNAYDLGEIVLEKAQTSFTVMHGAEDILAMGSVEMYNAPAEANWTVTSPADWTLTVDGDSSWFELSAVSGVAGASNLKLTFKDGTSDSNEATLVFTAGEKSFSVKIFRKAYSFCGYVKDGNGFVSGAKVLVTNEYMSTEAITDANGYFNVKVPNAFYNITVSKDGLGSKEFTSYAMAGADVNLGTVDFSKTSITVTGTVIDNCRHCDKYGDSLAGVFIEIENSSYEIIGYTVSDENGEFSFEFPEAGRYNINFLKAGYMNSGNYVRIDENTESIELKFMSHAVGEYPVNYFNGHSYLLIAEHMTWKEAKAYCELMGGHLITINSEEEHIFNYVDCNPFHDIANSYVSTEVNWLGLEAGSNSWITGEPLTFTNWNSSYSADDTVNNMNIAYRMRLWDDSFEDGWYVMDSNTRGFFICEWDSVIDGVITSGKCGDNLTWKLDVYNTLTISGTGAMYDYDSYTNVPWYSYRDLIKCVVVEDGVTTIGKFAFHYIKVSHFKLPETLVSIGEYAFSGNSYLGDIELPESLETIGYGAFSGCYLKHITIPKNVKSIGNYVFGGCNNLRIINVDPDNQYYCSKDGMLFSKDMTRIIAVTIGSNSFIIPASVTDIENVFWDTAISYELYFLGDAPASLRANLSSVITLYYIEGKQGWTSPTWTPYPGGKAYNTATWTP